MRTSVVGLWDFWNKSLVEMNTDGFAKVTHFGTFNTYIYIYTHIILYLYLTNFASAADSRCVGSARIVTLTIRALLTVPSINASLTIVITNVY